MRILNVNSYDSAYVFTAYVLDFSTGIRTCLDNTYTKQLKDIYFNVNEIDNLRKIAREKNFNGLLFTEDGDVEWFEVFEDDDDNKE